MFALDPDLVERTRLAWGDKLRPVPPHAPHPVLPPALREFVESVGLPTDNCWDAQFHDLPPQPPLHIRDRDFAVLGFDHGVPIAIDIAEGSVWMIQSGTHRLINSSLLLFLHALGRLGQLYRDLRGSRPEVYRIGIEDLRAELSELDPPSLGPGPTAWQDYFDEMVSE